MEGWKGGGWAGAGAGGSHHKVEHNRATSIYSQGVDVAAAAAVRSARIFWIFGYLDAKPDADEEPHS